MAPLSLTERVKAMVSVDGQSASYDSSGHLEHLVHEGVVGDRQRRAGRDSHGLGLAATTLAPPVTENRILLPTVFNWNFGGNQVFLTGSFNHWSSKMPMIRSHNDFTLILDIPPGLHQYKFIVDGEWRFAPDQHTSPDAAGRIHNVIQVDPPSQRSRGFDLDDKPTEWADEPSFLTSSTKYGQIAPLNEDYMREPPLFPPPHVLCVDTTA
eukprot:TRINITY_DN3327_c0_g1_i3.p1 TRINITY_DN3327_c0_g1~~TRINITY_DN3327_c0_g1_i3.p1  ORF type:complete len:210 (-),score=25.77 TRINITY_DN3327_c0_g1_i3:2-631(-)